MTWIRAQWDRTAALVALLIGLVAFALGWAGVSGTSFVAEQLPYVVSGALFGIFMLGIAAVLWLSADLRDEWRELRGIRGYLGELAGSSGAGRVAFDHPSARHTSEFLAVSDPDVESYGESDPYGLSSHSS